MQVETRASVVFEPQAGAPSQVMLLLPPPLPYTLDQFFLVHGSNNQMNIQQCFETTPTSAQQPSNSFPISELKSSLCEVQQCPAQLHTLVSTFVDGSSETSATQVSNISCVENASHATVVHCSDKVGAVYSPEPPPQQPNLCPAAPTEHENQESNNIYTETSTKGTEENTIFQKFEKLVANLVQLHEHLRLEKQQRSPSNQETTIEVSNERNIDNEHCQNNINATTLTSTFPSLLSLLNHLCSEVMKLGHQKLLPQIPATDLMTLIQILHNQIKHCKNINFKHLFEQGKNVVASKEYQIILVGLEAAAVILNIIIIDDVPKSVISEEAIEDILALCKLQMRGCIFPIFDPSYHEEETPRQRGQDDDVGDSFAVEDEPIDNDVINESEKVAKKIVLLKKESSNSWIETEQLTSVLNKLTEILNTLNQLVTRQHLTDSLILDLTNISLSAFFVEGIPSIQLSAFALIRTIFSRYSQHRMLILDEIFCNLSKLPKSKRSLRTYQLVEQKKSIQMVSALLMQLIQCCTALPPSSRTNKDSQQNSLLEESQVSQNSYTGAIQCANSFCHTLLKYCSLKNKENDYRPILQNLVEDLLITLNLPEWPAAEVLLLLLTKALIRILLTIKKADKKEMVTFDDEPKKGSRKSLRDDPQEVLGALSIHLLGLIAARLRQDIILVEQGAIFFAPPPRKLIEGSSEQEDFSCLCGTGNGQGFMLDCDDCHRWFHGECVGINPSAVPATWYCDQCLLRRQLQEHKQSIIERDEAILKGVCQDKLASILLSPTRQKRKIADDLTFDTHLDEINRQEVKGDLCSQGMTTANKDDSHTPVIKQLILNYLLHKSKVDPAALYARQFFLAQWNYEDDNDNAEYYRAQWSFTNEKSFAIHGAPSLSHDGTRKILVHLVATRELLKSFPRLLNEILCVLNESSTRYRTRAIRALSLIVESDPNILGWPKVQASVKGRLYDQAISVREAAVDLVGRYILYRPDFARHYFDYLAERFEDVGLSVRKRVVKIAQSICWLEPSSPLTSSILVHLSKRMNDEDVVKELVMKTFKNLWFTNDQRKMWKGELSEPLIVDHTTKEQNNGANSYDIRVKVKQILEVISCDNAGNNEWFVELVQGLLKRKENDEPKCNKDIYHICEQMCDCLMELLLQIDEGVPSSSSTKVPSLKSATLSNNVEENGPSKLGSIFTLLNLFCKVSPQLLVSHAETLQPYLKSQREEDAHIHQEIASILEKVVPLIEPPDYQFMQSLMSDLQSLVNTSLTPVVQSCMKSICTIAKFSRNFILPKQMYNNFFNFLEALKPEMKMVSKQKIFAIRSLYALGLLCKYFDFDQDAARNQLLATNKKITYGTHIEKLYEMYTKYWNHEDLELKIAALKGLGCIMASYPGLFLRAEPILSEALSLTSSTRLKMAAIKIFSEFLDFEEQKMEELGEKNAMRTTKERNEVKENADYGVTAAIIQKHLKPILEHMFDRDINVRLQALNLVYQIVRRSLIHPIQCVPHLIALETERNIALSEKAHRTLRVIEEKHPTMIHNRISEGLLLSYTFQTKIFGSGRAIRVTQTKEGQSLKESSLGRFYSLCAGSKTGRNAFLSSVIHLFETNESNEQFLKYLTLATAALPFTLQDEPLYLIYHINRVTSFRGAQLLVSLKEKIKHLDEIGTKNEELSKECKAMVSVILLLRLKKFLKCFYGLSNSKIHQFLPQDSKLGLLNSKVPIEAADFKTLLNIEDLKEGNWECNSKLCEQVFNIFKQELKNDEFNHNALPYYSSTKRGGSGTRKRRATLSKQVDENGGSVPKTKRPLKRRRLSQNDDPDADYVPL